MKYSKQLLYYFHHCTHAGRLDPAASSVYDATVGNVENGEVLALSIDYQDQVVEARFQAAGSVVLIAGGEFICRWLEKKTWLELDNLSVEFILEALDLSKFSIPAAHLILMAVKKLRSVDISPSLS